jgi:uncharacterized protein (TIGR01244 family)
VYNRPIRVLPYSLKSFFSIQKVHLMNRIKLSILLTLLVGLSGAVNAFAQEHSHDHSEKRKPAQMLPAAMSDILLSERRMKLEDPKQVLDYMKLEDGDLVADIGCGNGFYSLQVAERIGPHGAVFAVDVQQGMLDQMVARANEAEIKNIYPVLGAFTDPNLPPGKIDWMLLVDAYHEFSDPEAMLARMKESLAPDGKIALLEYRAEEGQPGADVAIPRDHKMTVDEVMSEWVPAGFELMALEEFLPAQHLFIFEASKVTPLTVGETQNVSTYNNKVYFAGQPSEADFKKFADLGVKHVINLRTGGELANLGYEEDKVVAGANMEYRHMAMGRDLPTGSELDALFAAIDKGKEDGGVLIHCASSNRVGTVWAAYRGLNDKLPKEAALAEGKAAGMRAEGLIASVTAVLE